MLLEIACFNLPSCLIAQNAGANRIEFCDNYAIGGITPSEGAIVQARQSLDIDLFVMIRPRGGDFVYTDSEFEQMKAQILFCKKQQCEGVVFGILDANNNIDTQRCKELVELARPLQCTFHRAFDRIENAEKGLEELIFCGFERVLTSGLAKSAMEGTETLQNLVTIAQNRITILVGGGVRSSNITTLMQQIKTTEFHSAAIVEGDMADEMEIRKILSLCNLSS